MAPCAVLVCVALAQSPAVAEFPADDLVRGEVRGVDGQPIARARVTLRCESDHSAFSRAISTLLWALPVVPAITGRDGEYVMPLTERHRLAYGLLGARWSIAIDVPGFLPYREPLARGLRGYFGSVALLRPITPSDAIAVEPVAATPGLLLLQLFDGQQSGLPFRSSRAFPVDGHALIPVPIVPSPLALRAGALQGAIGYQARWLSPGASTSPSALRWAGGNPTWQPGEPRQPTRTVAVRTTGGAPPTGLRALYRCPDDELRWFALRGEQVREDPQLQLIAIDADDALATAAVAAHEIELRPAPTQDTRLQIVVESGEPLPAAVGYAWPAAASEYLHDRKRIQPARPRIFRADAAGRIRLRPSDVDGATVLELRAPGFQPAHVFEPRGRTEPVTLVAAASAALEVTVASPRGPLQGAAVILSDGAFASGLLPTRPSWTDRDGRVTVPSLAPGRHTVRVAARGYSPVAEVVEVGESETTELELELRRSSSFRVRTVDDKGQAAPFVPVTVSPRNREVRALLGRNYLSDSLGRLLIDDLPADEPVSAMAQRHTGTATVELDPESSAVTELIAPSAPWVRVRLPDDSWPTRRVVTYGGGASSTGFADVRGERAGASELLLRWDRDTNLEVRVGLASAPPVRITGAAVEAAARDADVARLDRRRIVRRTPLAITGPDLGELGELRIQIRSPHYGGGMISNASGELFHVDGDRPVLVARDTEAMTCRVLHPEYLPLDLDVPEARDGEAALAVELTPGTPVTFRVPRRTDEPTVRISAWVRSAKGGETIVYAQDSVMPAGDGDTFEWRLPCALAAGTYTLTWRAPGYDTLSRADLVIREGEPVTLDVSLRTN